MAGAGNACSAISACVDYVADNAGGDCGGSDAPEDKDGR